MCKGCIEELVWCRQIYKMHLSDQAMDSDRARNRKIMFEGVAGDKEAQGELFGVQNLFALQKESFLSEIQAKEAARNAAKNEARLRQQAKHLSDELAMGEVRGEARASPWGHLLHYQRQQQMQLRQQHLLQQQL